MEAKGNEEEPPKLVIPKSSSFSPKVTRPKLPSFARKRSSSPRHKTDPGHGEIQAIMQDILNLNKVDFVKTYSRPITLRSQIAQKSSSTDTSPTASPAAGSPTVDDPRQGFTRNRSRSLKLLTNKLKKFGPDEKVKLTDPNTVSEEVKAHMMEVEKSAGSGEDLDEMSKSTDSESKAPSCDSPVPDADTLLAMRKISQCTSADEDSSREFFDEAEENALSDAGGEGHLACGQDTPKIYADDEGLGNSDEHQNPVVSTFTYQPIGRNSPFLKLAATAPYPKRRTGITTLKTLNKVQNLYGKGDDDGGSRRQQRLEGSSPNNAQKASPVRFITHPPHRKAAFHEEGAMDSNGFAAFKSSSGDSDEEGKQSQTSLADSHLCPSDGGDIESYQDAVESVTTEGNDPEKQDRKNGKSVKQKSKSDPGGNKCANMGEFPSVTDSSVSQSAPLLSKEDRFDSIDEDYCVSEDDSKTGATPERYILIGGDESGNERTSDEDDKPDRQERERSPRDTLSPVKHGRTSASSVFSSAPPSPKCQSPTNVPDSSDNLLSVPTPRKPILRSASSASVLQRDRLKFGSSSGKDKSDVIRKYSITTDDNNKGNTLVPDFTPLGDTGGATSMPSVWRDRILTSDSPERDPDFVKDKRYHIVEELYRNEKEYVETLKTLKDKYMVPLKTQSSLDENIVDNIFYMIPEILIHHSIFLDFLDNVWKYWNPATSTVGNIITSIFSKQTVLESYLSFVENYKTSGKAFEHALQTKSSVQKFVENCQRESGIKLSMKDLIVRPIQRIPRYELLLQRLISSTPLDHPDYPLLEKAEKRMHDLALKIGSVNDSQHEEDMQETLKKLELLLITDLAVPDRAYLRHDMVQIINKKDQCCIWLFSDLIIVSSMKRKSGPVPRKVSIILKTPAGQDFAENTKHKVWLRIGLDDIEIVKTQGTIQRKPTIDRDLIEEDINLINQISDLSTRLSVSHSGLDDALREVSSLLNKQLTDSQLRSPQTESNKLELLVTAQEGILHLVISFISGEKRALWENSFYEAKNKLSLLSDKRAPEFLQPLQITKTRAGMQFSCAAPIDGLSNSGFRDVWVCNSDGYVGHMCLLSLQPEPIVTLNTPVPGCNARILCISSVPAYIGAFRRKSSQKGKGRTLETLPSEDSISDKPIEGPTINVEKCEEEDMETAGEDGYQSDSESSDDEPLAFSHQEKLFVREEISDEEGSKPVPTPTFKSTPDPITTSGNWVQDAMKSTMWLGTEDGCIHIFQCTDNIKTTKNKLKIQHTSAVYGIVYLDNKVFVSLANGDLIVYKRDQGMCRHEGLWNTANPYTRTIGSAQSPIAKMLAVAGKLWCGCQNTIYVINPSTLGIEKSFIVNMDSNRAVQCMVCSGQGVWIASQQSSKVNLFHATTYEFLLEVSIAQAVSQKLQSADDIIRQHKAACLRLTALLVCKDLLWVGTSAGVILTIPIPKITSTTTNGSLATPSVTGLVHGHTGHVRFLTCVDISNAGLPKSTDSTSKDSAESYPLPDLHRRSSMATMTATMATRMLVISGGDGYEDFHNNSANESAGRDDSTNHLLLWQV
ncbi:rho guanine nucleotide exchange factor 17 [Patella vulgata]|uniref:rho guanine nucleotide exchange factor 17 n=1 Tax=Patella vulgata TaxID=6465 RepID=UPI00217F80CA|nr:rho guanine nucleotide exchange factor 17 [Patella vulgata]